jgi:hypothetical protein
MAVALHGFTTVKRKSEKVVLNAALQNEEKLNTLRLGLLQIQASARPVDV